MAMVGRKANSAINTADTPYSVYNTGLWRMDFFSASLNSTSTIARVSTADMGMAIYSIRNFVYQSSHGNITVNTLPPITPMRINHVIQNRAKYNVVRFCPCVKNSMIKSRASIRKLPKIILV